MNDFTYELPFSIEKLLIGIFFELKRKGFYDITHLLNDASISYDKGNYSPYDKREKMRSDALSIYVKIHLNPLNIQLMEENVKYKKILIEIIDNLIPANVGFDVKDISYAVDLTKEFNLEDDLLIDLEMQTERISNSALAEILPEDIKIKGFKMAEFYTYLYSVENSIRLFIIKLSKEKYGEDYFKKLAIPSYQKKTIEERKENAKMNKWLSVRDSSDIFYLDFKDLSSIIKNNWEIFENYFPTQEFITSKLTDMANCRNLIAHNSFVGDTERNLVKSYYDVILKQLMMNKKIV